MGFSGVIHRSPPQIPAALLRKIGIKETTSVGKVSRADASDELFIFQIRIQPPLMRSLEGLSKPCCDTDTLRVSTPIPKALQGKYGKNSSQNQQ